MILFALSSLEYFLLISLRCLIVLPQKFYCRTGDKTEHWTWRNRGRGENLQATHLLPWSVCRVGSQGVKDWDKTSNGGRDVMKRRYVGSTGVEGKEAA